MNIYTGIQMADGVNNPSKDLTKIKSLTANELEGLRWFSSYVSGTTPNVLFKSLFARNNQLWKYDTSLGTPLVKQSTSQDEADGYRYFQYDGGYTGNVTTWIKALDNGADVTVVNSHGNITFTKTAVTDTLVDVIERTTSQHYIVVALFHQLDGVLYISTYMDGSLVVEGAVLTVPVGFAPNKLSLVGTDVRGIMLRVLQDGFLNADSIHECIDITLTSGAIDGALIEAEIGIHGGTRGELGSALGIFFRSNSGSATVFETCQIWAYDTKTGTSLHVCDTEYSIDGINSSADGSSIYFSTVNGKSYVVPRSAAATPLEIPYTGKISMSYNVTYATI